MFYIISTFGSFCRCATNVYHKELACLNGTILLIIIFRFFMANKSSVFVMLLILYFRQLYSYISSFSSVSSLWSFEGDFYIILHELLSIIMTFFLLIIDLLTVMFFMSSKMPGNFLNFKEDYMIFSTQI